jgi:tRNA-2-methylthio-N6-dimethylallyladenosine synthase
MTTRKTDARRAYVETYGCQMNVADGELMQGILAADGYEIVASPDDADVILVNTCAIRDHAERRVLGRVGQLSGLKRDRPGLLLGVTGCMAQRLGRALFDEATHVDLVVGPDAYRSLPEQLRRLRGEGSEPAAAGEASTGAGKGRRLQLAVLDFDLEESYEGLEQRRGDGASAWVPIQRGCDHRCTFCIVPHVRGPEKNRAPDAVLDEVRSLAERGVTEVTLLGQTVNSYAHGEWSFADLLRAVARVDGIRRVRFTSPHPNDVTRALVEVMATEEAVCEHLHLPVQSGSDRILRRMLRRYTVASYLDKVRIAREEIPDLAISTDIIVAFPGESRSDFDRTLDLVREVEFDEAYTYRYSLREGTPATRLPAEDFVPDEEAAARLEELIGVSRDVQGRINAAEVGRQDEVLAEKAARDPGHLLGRTRRNKFVVFPSEDVSVGDYAWVELRGTTGPTFRGNLVGSLAGGACR